MFLRETKDLAVQAVSAACPSLTCRAAVSMPQPPQPLDMTQSDPENANPPAPSGPSGAEKAGSRPGGISRRDVLRKSVAAAAAASLASRTAPLSGQDPVLQHAQLPVVPPRKPCHNVVNQGAADDYCRSLASFGGRLSSPPRQLFLAAQKPDEIHFSVVVVGSGYGGAICAARISQRLKEGHRIAVLERGKEWIPGSFPDSLSAAFGNTRQQMAGPGKGQVINPLGLYNIQFNKEVNILNGSGLGGTSLINANVALKPHPETFQQDRWPEALRNPETLAPYYDLAARQLSLTRTPPDQVLKVARRRRTAEAISGNPNNYDRSPVAVMYDHRYLDDQFRNPQRMIQRPCTLCGDCITGCNVGAKNTLAYNYLPVARWNGTEMYTQVQVDRVVRKGGYYRLHLTYIDESEGRITRHPVEINARVVILACGSPASSEVLMESQNDQFCFSPSLGSQWTANGNALGFVVDMGESTNVGGVGTCPGPCDQPVGTTVQATLNFYDRPGLCNKFILQDAAIPRGVSPLFSLLLRDRSLDHSMVMLAIGHDEANGRIVWKDGRYQIDWPGLTDSGYRQMIFSEFEKIAWVEGGRYKRLKAFGKQLVTVHPLGGCNMADDPRLGVVNQLGQVFDGRCGGSMDPATGTAAVHPGLYVADGSIIPTALGANPYLTICALAERIAGHLVEHPAYADLFQG